MKIRMQRIASVRAMSFQGHFIAMGKDIRASDAKQINEKRKSERGRLETEKREQDTKVFQMTSKGDVM